MSGPKLDIVDAETEIHEEAIEILEDALARVRKGEMQDVVVVGSLVDGATYCNFTRALNCIQRVGMIEMVKLDWYHRTVTPLKDPEEE